VVHGRKRPSLRIAARLDDVLEAGGELVTLAETAGEALEDEAEREGTGRRAGEAKAEAAEGMTLRLPYVPGRLVIEVSGPAGNPGLPAGDRDDLEATPARLALVPDHRPRAAQAEAAGR
jgi:hypothetical protein